MRSVEIWVVRDDNHSEGTGPEGHFAADAAESDDAERLALEFDAGVERSVPASFGESAVGVSEVTGGREDHRHGVLRCGHHVGNRGVHDDEASLRRLGDVDVVHADAGTTNHLECWRRIEELCVDRCR